ncbi:MAG: hypothetical protein ACXWEI_21700, partial [Mycobacterium sp.]
DYYTNQFAPTKKSIGEDVDVDAVLPDTNAARYLQAYYTAPFSDWDESIKFDDARDGSARPAPTPSVLPPSFRWTTRPTTSSRC